MKADCRASNSKVNYFDLFVVVMAVLAYLNTEFKAVNTIGLVCAEIVYNFIQNRFK